MASMYVSEYSELNFTNYSEFLLNHTFPHALNMVKEKVYWALMMIPLPLVAVVGNILVILSVYKEKSLQTATNYFIVSLAFADLLVAAVVMPFAVYVLVNVDWELSETVCDFYIALDVTCSTASIFNLVAISIDRFIAVTQPIKYAKHKNNKRVFLTIAIVWLVSAAIGSPIVLGLNTSHERIPNLCIFYNADFIIYSSLSSFYIPCLVMIYLYYKIFKAIHKRAKKAIGNQKRKPKAMKPEEKDFKDLVIENESRADLAKHCLHFEAPITHEKHKQILSPLKETPENQETPPFHCNGDYSESNKKKSPDTANDCEVISNQDAKTCSRTDIEINKRSKDYSMPHPLDCVEDAYLRVKEEQGCSSSPSRTAFTNSQKLKTNGLVETQSPVKSRNNSTTAAAVETEEEGSPKSLEDKKRSRFSFVKRKKSSKKREKNAARRERKATKTLAIVLGVFLICWVPFFTCNIMDAICIKLENDTFRPGMTSFLLTTWLGYINSCINPVIYTIFNMEFRKAFKKLLMNPCH